MRKSLLAASIALTLGAAATTASAATISVTQMIFGGTNTASGTVSTDLTGSFGGSFFFAAWTATPQASFIGAGAYTWAGTSPMGAYSYNFTLSASEIGFGLYFDWSGNDGIPVLAVFDCGDFTVGNACVGTGPGTVNGGYPMQTMPFPNSNPTFNGILIDNTGLPVTEVPLPAAVWLLGTGLLGLAGLTHRSQPRMHSCQDMG